MASVALKSSDMSRWRKIRARKPGNCPGIAAIGQLGEATMSGEVPGRILAMGIE